MVNLNIGWNKAIDEPPPKDRPFLVRIIPIIGLELPVPLPAVYTYESWQKARAADSVEYSSIHFEWSELPEGTSWEYKMHEDLNNWHPISDYKFDARAVMGFFPDGLPGHSIDHRYAVCHGKKFRRGDEEVVVWKNNYNQPLSRSPTFFQYLRPPK